MENMKFENNLEIQKLFGNFEKKLEDWKHNGNLEGKKVEIWKL